MKTFYIFFYTFLLTSFLQAALPTGGDNRRDFTNVLINGKESVNIYGNLLLIGNQLLCQNSADGAACEEPTIGVNNNSINQHKAKIDTSSDAPPSNTWAKLTLEEGNTTSATADTIIYARLYWSARISSPNSTEIDNARKIKIKGPKSTTYTELTAPDNKMNWYESSSTKFDYAASIEVTDYVKANRSGKYYVGNIQADNGSNKFASWALVVIVENPERPFNNIAIYDGFKMLMESDPPLPDNVTVSASGFITPTESNVYFKSSLFVYTGETESGLDDGAEIQDINGNWHQLSDGYNDTSDVFNASIYTPEDGFRSNHSGEADPNFQNVIGTDIDKLEINKKDDPSKQFLSPKQTSTQIRIHSDGDRYTLNMFAFETELYIPKFCYDYAYSQQGVYFTEKNDGTELPRLTGSVIQNEPIQVKIFIRNLVDSDIQITDMNVSVLDINTSQTTYIRNSTELAKNGDLIPSPLPDTNVADNYIKDLQIGSVTSNDFFYIYYSLDPKLSDLNDSINVKANYNLTLGGVTIPYSLILGDDMEMCSTSNFKYAPAKGIFNIVHNNYFDYDNGGSNRYYNLPTQITQRVGDFKVVSMDPINLDEVKETSTVVAVEMIDASAFHDTNASCMEMASSISQRVWVVFDSNVTSVPFDNTVVTPSFYSTARQNAAFRVSFNVMDENGTVPLVQKENDGTFTIINWRTAWDGESCAQDMDGNPNNLDSVAGYCNDTGNNPNDLAQCMECIYGKDIRMICSRDNFSIRPEAFMLNIDDQNQSTPTSQSRLTTNYSGAVGATAPVIDLAADYDYNLEINASNHLSPSSSYGYTRSFNAASPNDTAEYRWEPRTGVTSGACNDESNRSLSIRFVNGEVDANTSVQQVGEYRLHLLDTTWTAVDSDPTFMTHHVSPYFYLALDCAQNSSATQLVNAASLNGCNISTTHLNPTTNEQYNDFNVTFHPYQFTVVNNVTLGKGNGGTGVTPPTTFKPFVYMNNISGDENMSVHLNTTITARGQKSASPLTNFVTGCFAQPLNVSIGKTATTNPLLRYSYRVHNRDINGTVVPANDINQTIAAGNVTQNPVFATTSAFFHKNQNGSSQILTNLNYDRDVNVTTNPEDINFTTISVDDNATLFNADLVNNKYAEGNVSVNQRVLHYYGRTISPKITVVCNNNTCRTGISGTNNNNIKELISYVVFCQGGSCNSSILPTGALQVADARWFENRNHDRIDGGFLAPGTDGTIGAISEVAGTGWIYEVGARAITQNQYETEVTIEHNAAAPLPYDAIMQMQSSPWLINNDIDANATTNTFIIQFVGDGGWSGKYEENTTTKTNFNTQTNRRIMW